MCEYLGIGPEADYFGLRLPLGPHTAPALQGHEAPTSVEHDRDDGPWANLRHHLPGIHRRLLRLRVKFWVPPHRLLLEATRRQFYQQARHDLVDGKLIVADWRVACRLVALIAQVIFENILINIRIPYYVHIFNPFFLFIFRLNLVIMMIIFHQIVYINSAKTLALKKKNQSTICRELSIIITN